MPLLSPDTPSDGAGLLTVIVLILLIVWLSSDS